MLWYYSPDTQCSMEKTHHGRHCCEIQVYLMIFCLTQILESSLPKEKKQILTLMGKNKIEILVRQEINFLKKKKLGKKFQDM